MRVRGALEQTADIVLTSYPILRNDIEVLQQVAWDTVILDESQNIKNPDSQVARAAYRLRGRWKATLSGTPVENRLDELWSQLHFTNPGLLGGRTDFQQRWAEPIGLGDDAAAARLRERIRPFVLRRMKREVAKDLPPRTDAVMYVELDETERATYDAIRAATQRDIVKLLESGGGVMAALEALLRLRQAACHTALLPGGMRPKATPQSSSKLERLMEALDDVVADGHRALVFSQWTSLLDLIEPHLDSAGVAFVRLDGSTTDRAGVVGTFQADNGPPVMLLSLKAGGTGLNLTAADHVFLVDPWWNPAVEDQAADRAHRIGQDRPVMVYRDGRARHRPRADPRAPGQEAPPRRRRAVRGRRRRVDHARGSARAAGLIRRRQPQDLAETRRQLAGSICGSTNSRVTAVLRSPSSSSLEISAPASTPTANSSSPLPIAFANVSATWPDENRNPYGRRHHMSWPFDVRYQIRGGRKSTSCSIVTSRVSEASASGTGGP